MSGSFRTGCCPIGVFPSPAVSSGDVAVDEELEYEEGDGVVTEGARLDAYIRCGSGEGVRGCRGAKLVKVVSG